MTSFVLLAAQAWAQSSAPDPAHALAGPRAAGHGIPFRAIAGPPHLQEGEAAVLRWDALR